jgi:hypothetical protein
MDWSPQGVPWEDESMDGRLADDWLRQASEPDFPETDTFARVLELSQSDLDPERGWRLAKMLVEKAPDDDRLWSIGARVLATMLTNHPDVVADELAVLAGVDGPFRRALEGQISPAIAEFRRAHGFSRGGRSEGRGV